MQLMCTYHLPPLAHPFAGTVTRGAHGTATSSAQV